MAAQRVPRFPGTSSLYPPHALDASSIRLEDNIPPVRRNQPPRDFLPPPPDDPTYPHATVERQWTNFYTEDGVRLYRPSGADLKQARYDPRGGPQNDLFADDEPWLPSEVDAYPEANERAVIPSVRVFIPLIRRVQFDRIVWPSSVADLPPHEAFLATRRFQRRMTGLSIAVTADRTMGEYAAAAYVYRRC